MKLNIFLGAVAVFLTLSAVNAVHSHSVGHTRVEADSINSEIRLIIDNKIVARLTDSAMIVEGSLIYTGTLRDAPEGESAHE